MAVAALEVVTTTAAALTLGGGCGGCGVEEAESSEGGTVLHLQALGGVGHGAVDKPTEEGAGEGEGGIVIIIADSTAKVADSCPPH